MFNVSNIHSINIYIPNMYVYIVYAYKCWRRMRNVLVALVEFLCDQLYVSAPYLVVKTIVCPAIPCALCAVDRPTQLICICICICNMRTVLYRFQPEKSDLGFLGAEQPSKVQNYYPCHACGMLTAQPSLVC